MDRDTANEVAAGAPGTLELGGHVWLVSQPDTAEFGTLRKWIRKRMRRPLQALAEDLKGLPLALQQAAVARAVELHESGSAVTEDRIQDELATVDGCSFWLWLLCRKNHPDCTPDTFRALLTEDTVFGVLADLLETTDLKAVEKNGRGATGSAPSPPVPAPPTGSSSSSS